jgi:hypothetical protein
VSRGFRLGEVHVHGTKSRNRPPAMKSMPLPLFLWKWSEFRVKSSLNNIMGLREGGKEAPREPILIRKTDGLQKYSGLWFEAPTSREKSRAIPSPHSLLLSLAKGKGFVNRLQRIDRMHACPCVGEGVMLCLATQRKSL